MRTKRASRICSALGLAALGLFPAWPAATQEDLRKDALEFFGPPLPERATLPPDNPFSREKAVLGRKLFNDPRLSDDGKTTCASCHAAAAAGADKRPAVVGHSWQTSPRNAPSVYNAILNTVIPMDRPGGDRIAPQRVEIRGGIDLGRPAPAGRRSGGEGGEKGGPETGRIPAAALQRLEGDPAFMAEMKVAFPGQVGPLTARPLALAIEAYLSTLLTPSAFDRFLAGDDNALSPIEKIGLAAFIDKGCVACHGGTNFGGTSYETFAIGAAPVRPGEPAPLHRSAPLRNVALTPPYFHQGTVPTLEGAVAAMLKLQTTESSLDGDVKTIVAFLKTLNGTPPAAN